MSRAEALVIGSLRYSRSPLLGAVVAIAFLALGGMTVGAFASSWWDVRVLAERGVVVSGEVVAVPGLVGVTWPEIAPASRYLEAGDDAAVRYTVGDDVDVVVDPTDPGRARLAGVPGWTASDSWGIAGGVGVLLLGIGYGRWALWLRFAHHADPRGGSAAGS